MKNAVRLLSLVSLSTLLTACGGGGGGTSPSITGGGANSSRLGSHQAQFIDAPTEGLQYYQDDESQDYRVTGVDGVFYCNLGSKVTFSLRSGYSDLGSVTCGAGIVFPRDLDVVNADSNIPKYIALLLHHMDNNFDGQDYSFSTTNNKIIISEENVNLLEEASLDFDPEDVNSIMATINEVRSIRCLKQHVRWPLNVGDDRGLLETQCKIDNAEWRTLANAELDTVLAEMDTHLSSSIARFEDGATHTFATQSEVLNFIRTNGQQSVANFNSTCYSWNSSAVQGAIYGVAVIDGQNYVRIPQDETTFCSIDSAPQTVWTGVEAVDAQYDTLLAIDSIVHKQNSIITQWNLASITDYSAQFHAKVANGNYNIVNADQVTGPTDTIRNDSGRFIKVGNEIRYYYSCSNFDAVAHPEMSTPCGMDFSNNTNEELENLNNY